MRAIALDRGAAFPMRRQLQPAAVFVFVVAGLACLRPALDPDVGWHLRTGQVILSTGTVPRFDPFSFTMAGHAWVDNEWLWELGLAAVNAAGGFLMVIGINAAITATAVGLIYLTLRHRGVSPLMSATGSMAALVNLLVYADVRPGMTGVLCAALMLYLLERHETDGRLLWLVALLPVEAVWANAHGSYVSGIVLFGAFGVAQLWTRRSWQSLRRWASAGAALCLVTLLNPLGIGLIGFTLDASRLTFNREVVEAWQAPDFHQPGMIPFLASLTILVGLLAVAPRARLSTRHGLLAAVLVLATLESRQFLPLFAVAIVPFVAQLAEMALDRTLEFRSDAVQLVAFSVVLVVLAPVPARVLSADSYAQSINRLFPTRAVEFIKQRHMSGTMWNEFNWGGYLVSALPDIPVLVDSRTEMYGDAFLYEYYDVMGGRQDPAPMMNRYGISMALIRSTSVLARELSEDQSWREVYQDDLAAVFTRDAT